MKKILKKFTILSLFLLMCTALGGVKWQTNMKKAQAKAAQESKDIFVYFTGSDWCSYCIMLHKQVFDKGDFLENLEKEYVLLKLDYPRAKQLPKIERELNDKWSMEYSIEGFPTVLLLDKDGRAFAKTGFKDGGPAEYAAHLKALKSNKLNRDRSFAEAAKLNGVDKAEALIQALTTLGDAPKKQYKNIQKDIVEADPEDKTGYQKNVLTKQALGGLESRVIKLIESKKTTEALGEIDKFIEDRLPEGETKQKAMILKIYTYSKDSANLDEVSQLMDSIIAIDPKSETAKNAQSIKAQVVELGKNKK